MNYTFNYIIGGTLLRRQVVHFYSGLDTCSSSYLNQVYILFIVHKLSKGGFNLETQNFLRMIFLFP